MKIGIVSFYDTQQNYGQVLQCYAMQNLFSSMGHEVFHLRYLNRPSTSKIQKVKKLWTILMCGLFGAYLENRRSNKQAKDAVKFTVAASNLDKRGFDEFRNGYLTFSEAIYTVDDLRKNPLAVDVWVTGSDQVWGIGVSELFQLQFGPKKAKKIAYAASMGGFQFVNKYQRCFFRKYLQDFDYISLREQDGVDACRALGFPDAHLVPDPTLLVNAETYRAISVLPDCAAGRKYVLLYLLGNPIALDVKEIFAWAQSNQYDVIYVAAQGREDDFPKYKATPQEWLALIDHAELVITNSFHGMVFSVLFKKQFLVIPICGVWSRMNSRLTTTLDELQISQEHIYAGDLNTVFAPVDYAATDRIIGQRRAAVVSELKSVLNQ